MIHQYRVIFGDTDQMGVVYYGNYMRFFEASRAALLRACGRSHDDLDAWGIALPVVEAHCRYRHGASAGGQRGAHPGALARQAQRPGGAGRQRHPGRQRPL